MKNEKDVQELKDELEIVTGFIAEYGTQEEVENNHVEYACDIIDALRWVLEEETTECFRSDAYLDMDTLNVFASGIEQRTGRKVEDYH
ncbi:MAG TPA: hypothetical protein VKA68_00300 [bacterium]|nr:hypothetical protein [bacterium]